MKDSALAFSFYTLLFTIIGVLSIAVAGIGLALEKLMLTETIVYVGFLLAFIIINIIIAFKINKGQRWSLWFALLEVATVLMYLLVTFVIDFLSGLYQIPFLALIHLAIMVVLYSDLRNSNNG